MKLKIFILIFFTLFSINFINAETKEGLYEKLIHKYGNMNSFSTNFELKNNPAFKGYIIATKGNKYIMSVGNRVITSNGKNIWNYSERDNNVIISNIEDLDENDVSIEQFFFNFLSKYKPTDLVKESSTKGQSAFQLVLKPQSKNDIINNVASVTIWVNQNNNDIYSIGITNNGSMEIWDLKDFKAEMDITRYSFDFEIPEDAAVIDMR